MATFFVTNTADSGAGSLRQAILDANLAAGADVIDFGSTSGTITLTTGELSITDDLTIDGDTIGSDNKANITISGDSDLSGTHTAGDTRIFHITNSANATLQSLTIADGYSTGNGGAIRSEAGTTLNLNYSTVRDSYSSQSGGGIRAGGTLVSTGSTISGNTAGNYGGGVSIGSSQSGTFINSTIDGNQGFSGGGISIAVSTLVLQNSTITNNTATATGGGVRVHNLSNVTVENTVIALNTAVTAGTNDVGHTGGLTSGTVTAGTSFFGTTVAIDTDNGGNQNNAGDPLLAALADNGGPVATRLVQAGSTLLNAGDNGVVTTANDANGNTRVQNTTVDIGASEAAIPATFVVSTTVDENDGDFSAGDLSLREAVLLAGSGDTITFGAALNGQTLTLASEITLAQDVTIDGDSNGDDKADVILSGGGTNRIFDITGGTTNLDSLDLTNGSILTIGYVAGNGGAIQSAGGTILNLTNSTVRDSSSSNVGGGIFNRGTLNVTSSTISGNTAGALGGGVYLYLNQSATFINSTVDGNTAGTGGGIFGATISSLTISNSTITSNDAVTGVGGGIAAAPSATTNVSNSVIALNTAATAGQEDLSVAVTLEAGNSFFGTNVTINTDNGGNQNNAGDPLLVALTDNGGPVATRLIQAESALIDAGSNGLIPGGVTTDANGNARTVNTTVDIGASEAQIPATFVVSTTVDENDGDFSVGDLSLREAVLLAGSGDTITFDAALAGQTLTLATEIALAQDINIDGDIDGDDKADITLNGTSGSRIFNLGAATNVDLLSLNFQNASTTVAGGAIYGYGFTSLDITDSTFSGISTTGAGGALRLRGNGTTNLTDSLLTGNHSNSYGGAIYASISHTLNLTNTTVHGNTTNANGGGIGVSTSTLNLFNSTITGNQADADGLSATSGGGLENFGSTIYITNSVIAENTSGTAFTADDVVGTIDNAANSFIGTVETITAYGGGGAGATTNGGGAPGLDVLADNGGTVQTRAILGGSALIDAGDNALVPVGITQDANGNARIVSDIVDIGAVEAGLVVDHLSDVDTVGATLAGDILDDGGLSLREAIAHAGAGDSITFANGLTGTITLTQGDINIAKDINIDGDNTGDDKADITISGGGASRIFQIDSGTTNLDSLTLTGGGGSVLGGAIFADSSATGLTIANSTIRGNSAQYGGGIFSHVGTDVVNSTFSDNMATGVLSSDGGGVWLQNGASSFTNTTFYNNSAIHQGGAIRTYSVDLTLSNSTIAGNTASIGGGVYQNGNGSDPLVIHNTVFGNNTGTTSNADLGLNNAAIDVTVESSFFSSDVSALVDTSVGGYTNNGGDPLLAALADNGGPVDTMLAQAGSQLINGGDNTLIPVDAFDLDDDGDSGEQLPIDANGNPRIDGVSVDIGASEAVIPASLVVSTLDDENDGDFSAGDLSLREAIALAGSGDTITFDAALAGTITLSQGQLDIGVDLTIDGDNTGDDKADIIVSGNNLSRIFDITAGTTNLDSLDITNGYSGSNGGAIQSRSGTALNLTNSTVRDSNSVNIGGGLVSFGTLNVTSSTISGNTGDDGGGVYVYFNESATFINSTIYDNTATTGYGGGIFSGSGTSLIVTNSTITNNAADLGYGGGIGSFGATANISNSVIALNTAGLAGTEDLNFDVTVEAGNSFFGTNVTITTDNGGNQNNAGDPMLAALADNGGPVQTMLALAGSQLINGGSNALIPVDASDLDNDGNTAEQLPVDANGNPRIDGASVDIGASEAIIPASLVVDSFFDENDGDFSAGNLSLREAIALANSGDTITFDGSLFGATLALTQGELLINKDLTIDGDINADNKADIAIQGSGMDRIFTVKGGGADVDLLSLNLTGGYSTHGGALRMYSGTSVDLVYSTVDGNFATTSGGGIFNQGGTLTVINSTIDNNITLGTGGGITAFSGSTTLVNTTIAQNTAENLGGGIRIASAASVEIFNSTIVGNHANIASASANSGGGIDNVGGGLAITNTVIAKNTSGTSLADDDVDGTVDTATNSFIGTTETITTSTATTNGGGDPLLGMLGYFGGPVNTVSLLAGSPLIDAGDDALVPVGVITDANGDARTVGTVDIGAVESTVALVVDTLVDEDDGDFSVGDLSLREAIALVDVGGTITFDASLSGQSIVLGSSLVLSRDVTIDGDIDGDNKADITLDGNNASRIISVSTIGTDVDLLSLTLTNGRADYGGALRMYSGTSVDLIDSTISGNVATLHGGGIYNQGGTLNVTNSTISGNSATSFGNGGGLFLINAGTTTLTNTTVDGNLAGVLGGGIFMQSAVILNINNSTVTSNQASVDSNSEFDGGGIYDVGGTTTLNVTNSVIALNTSYGASHDIYGTVDQGTNSFFGTTESITAGTGNINGGGDPLLAALADNGGTVQTRAILGGSQLIDAGDNGSIPGGITTDANGNGRIAFGTVDIGATEFQLVVTSASDTGLDNTIDGTLAADMADGGGLSLREAIGHATAGDEISFASALSGQTITLSGTELTIAQDLTIDGDSDGDNKADITISGNNASRIFFLHDGYAGMADVTLQSLTLTGGNGSYGGAIYARDISSLTVEHSTVSDSSANARGGGIFARGITLDVIGSTLSGNTAGNGGGGIYSTSAFTTTLTNTTVHDNSSTVQGGGIAASGGTLTLNNTTITGNRANSNGIGSYDGGGVTVLFGTANFNNTVVAGNVTGSGAGVADDVSNFVAFPGTIAAANSFFGTAIGGYNGGAYTDNGNNTNGGGDPLLGELLDNGGPVLTLSPLDGSPLIGTGSNALIPVDSFDIDDDGNTAETLPFDGRGGARILDTTVDIGAVEQFEDETIRGTDGVNNIVGGDGDDVLEGKGGADNIDGGGHGVNGDTVTYISSSGAVQVVLDGGPSTGNDAAGDVVTNVENIIGSNFGDVLTGNDNANFIDGGLGNDTLNGLGGNDILVGDFNQDTLNGGDDDDDLDGGAGNDIIDGGAGIDTGRYDSFGGAVIINLNLTTAQNTGAAGTETISNVENLIGGIGNDRFTGKVQVSVLEGGGGSDSLFGLGGDDILRGGEGNDNAQGGNGLDTLIGGNGRDTLVGGNGIDTINGDAGKDVIRGGDDGDIIDGGADRDVLIGGDFTGGGFPGDGAADTFVFSEVSDSAFGGATRDIIRDFEQGLDIIDLSAIDAITGGSDDAFTFIGTSNFSGTAGELRAFSIGGNTDVRVDVDGDGTADMEIFLNGTIAMTTGDFVL